MHLSALMKCFSDILFANIEGSPTGRGRGRGRRGGRGRGRARGKHLISFQSFVYGMHIFLGRFILDDATIKGLVVLYI